MAGRGYLLSSPCCSSLPRSRPALHQLLRFLLWPGLPAVLRLAASQCSHRCILRRFPLQAYAAEWARHIKCLSPRASSLPTALITGFAIRAPGIGDGCLSVELCLVCCSL